LLAAIRSVESQTYDNIELIIVDDRSPTPAEETIGEEQSKSDLPIKILRHDENRGASAARNTGIDVADGDYLAFLDDDDSWKPEKIERQVTEFIDSSTDVGVVYTGIEHVFDDDRTETAVSSKQGHVTKPLLCSNFVGSFSAVMVERGVIERAGSLDVRFPSWQDWEWYLRLSTYCQFRPVERPLVRHNHTSTGRITEDFETLTSTTYPLFVEKFSPLAKQFGKRFARKWRGYVAFTVAMYALNRGDYARTRQYLRRAIRLYPLLPTFYIHLLAVSGGEFTYEPLRKLRRVL